jgi:hypothetical protein
MVAFAGTVNSGVATLSTSAGPVHDRNEAPEFVMQSGWVVVNELGGVSLDPEGGGVVGELFCDMPEDLTADEVVVEKDDDVPADLVDGPPIVSASATATARATTTVGTT